MPNGDPMINNVGQQHMMMPSALPAEAPKQPGRFSRIFGGIAGAALNLVAPGAGSIIGGFLNRGSGGAGGPDFSNMQAMLQQQQQSSMQMLAIQNKVQAQTQEFTTVSNLLKSRHDSEMSAVNNFKS